MANKRENGQAMIIFAVSVVVLLVFTGLAVDSCNLYMTRRNTQTTADSAALASGLAIAQGKDQTAAAQKVATLNGLKSSDVTVNYPPTSGQFKDNTEYVQVFVKSKAAMSFMGMIGFKDTEVKSEAVVHLAGSSGPIGGDAILVAADPKNTIDSFWAHDGSKLTLDGGGIFINSKNQTEAFLQQGGSNIDVINNTIEVVGGFKQNNGAKISPEPITGVPQRKYEDILAPDCTKISNFNNDPTALNRSGSFNTWAPKKYDAEPGVYTTKIITGNSRNVTFKSGLYCLKDGMELNGVTIDAESGGVTFVLLGGDVRIWNGVWLTLSAPLSDKYYVTTDGSSANFKGLLFLGNPSVYSGSYYFQGGSKVELTGTFYMPGGHCDFSNGSKDHLHDVQMICNHIDIWGGPEVKFIYNKDHYYSPSTGTSLQLAR